MAEPRVRVRFESRLDEFGRTTRGYKMLVGNDTIGWTEVPCGPVKITLDPNGVPRARVTFFDPAVQIAHRLVDSANPRNLPADEVRALIKELREADPDA